MAATGVSRAITFEDDELRRALGRIVAGGENPAPLLDDIGAAMVQRTQLRFEKGVGPDGAPWPKSKRAIEQSGQTLVDTARLLQSITHLVDAGASAAAASVEWGTNVVYAAIHQFGGKIKREARKQTLAFDTKGRFASRANTRRRKAGAVAVAIVDVAAYVIDMPARPYIGVDDADRDVIQERVAAYFERVAQAGGAAGAA